MTTFPEPEPLETGTPQQVAEEALLDDVAAQVDALEQSVDMTPLDHPRRLLLVHAHPDDETIGTGATMAAESRRGALVALVTCTRGELGEVVDPSLADLAPAGPEDDRLGVHRVEELAAAMEALRVTDFRFLGGPGRWRDSGMAGQTSNDDPRCFWRADLDEAVRELVAVVREVRPQVIVTYDEHGGYGHPDHVQAHRVAVAAFDAAGDPSYAPEVGEPWQPAKLYYTAVPASSLEEAVASGMFGPDVTSPAELPFATPDELVTTAVDAREQFPAKVAAMRAHRSQIDLSAGVFAALVHRPEFGIEHFRLVRGEPGPGDGSGGRESDLFAGLQR